MNVENTVLLLPDGRIAQNRKDAKELMCIGSTSYKVLVRKGIIKRIENTKAQGYETKSRNQ